jgi:DNA-binding transcriptional LysR family regulator
MDRFAAMEAFVRVVEAGGFSQAARARGLATSSLTRQVDLLERMLGTKLLNRSTRRTTPTEAGQCYYDRAVGILDELEAADASIAGRDAAPQGLLRVSAPVAFSRLHVAPALPEFLSACPAIEIEMSLTDVVIDLAAEDIDLAIRIGPLGSTNVIARRLAPHRRILCASPTYLAARGAPGTPAELTTHSCLRFTYHSARRTWRFRSTGGTTEVQVDGPLRADNAEILQEAARAGLGIVLMPSWLVGEDIRVGRLVEVLPAYRASLGSDEAGIHAIWLPNRRGSPKVRALVDYLAKRFGPTPYWEVLG